MDVYLELPTAQQLRVIYATVNSTEDSIKNDVQYLMHWMEKQPHLPNVKDETLLTNFLLQCKNSVEDAKGLIERYYIFRATVPTIFTNRDPCQPWFQHAMNTGLLIPLPKLTPEGYRLILYRAFKRSPSDMPSAEIMIKVTFMLIELILKHDKHSGIILIYDWTNFSATLASIYLQNMKMFYTMNHQVLKVRPQKIYVLNFHVTAEPLFKLYKMVLKKKIVERMIFWKKKQTDLIEVLPKETLPSDYGGNLASSTELRDQLYGCVCKHRDDFLSDELLKADLTKKPKEREMNSNLEELQSGINGFFRKLCID